MKKILLATLFCLFALSVNAFALPFYSVGMVDPNFNNSWNQATLTGTARYYISFNNPDVLVNEASIRFEGDVFDLSKLDATKVNVVNPASWADFIWAPSGDAAEWSVSFGSYISHSDSPIMIDVNYTLLGLPDTLNWDEGQVWGQSFALAGKYDMGWGPFDPCATSGGSTAPVPEPASMAMLGMGILGLLGLRKRA